MNLVFLNQYYPPDAAPTGVMLEAVVEELARQGHQVTVICASGGYAGGAGNIECRTSNIEHRRKEKGSGGSATVAGVPPSNSQPSTLNHQPFPTIIRLPASRFGRGTFLGKLTDYASYYLGVAWKLLTLHPRPDRIIALTTPPYLSVLARLISKPRGADHAHWVMDLYPDVMAVHGMLGEKSMIYRVLARLARWEFGGRRCAAVLTLGPDMAERVGKYVEEFTAKAQRTRRDAEESGEGFSDPQPSTINYQLSPVQWVPLWGGERGNIEHRTSNLEHRREEGADSAFADTSQGRMNESRDESRGPYRPTGFPDASFSFDSQLSTIHSQLSSLLRLKRGWGDDELVVMYSGNMGLGHRFGEILEAVERLDIDPSSPLGDAGTRHRTPNIEHRREEVADSVASTPRGMDESRDESSGPWGAMDSLKPQLSTLNPQLSTSTRFVFFGGGKRRGEIASFIAAHPEAAVELHDYAPVEELTVHLQSADVHLASLDPAWTGTMVPSKLQGIFAAGRPVIFLGSVGSSIGRWVTESGGGWVVAADDVAGLIAALEEARDPAVRGSRGRAAKDFAEEHFDKPTNVARVAEVLGRKWESRNR